MKRKYTLIDQNSPSPSNKYIWFILSILLLTFTNTSLFAQTRTAEVMTLLEGYEWTLEPNKFLCLGDGTDTALREIASDFELPNFYRLRALSALSLFPNDLTADLLERTINEASSDASKIRRALRAYSEGFNNEPERVTMLTRSLLNTSTNRHIKAAAAETLASLNTQDAKQTLQDYLDTDLSSIERQRIENMINQFSSYELNKIQQRSTRSLLEQAEIECK
jgi:hypothetical protein